MKIKNERVMLLMPPDLIEAVKKRTETSMRTYNKEIIWIVSEFLKQEKGADQGTPRKR